MTGLSPQSVSLLNQKQFTIVVNNKPFVCSGMGVNSSKVIRELKSKDPNLSQYQYNFDGKTEDFQPICDLFNLKEMKVTISNMKSLLQIAEDLQIDSILEYITNYNDKFETIAQETEVIDEVFDNLCKLDKIPVETVTKLILESTLVHSEENIQELIAIILQVVNQYLKLQSKIIELLISLNKSVKPDNDLNLLLPLFIKQLKLIFYTSVFYCLFTYKMTRANLIPLTDIINEIYCKDSIISPAASIIDFNNSYHKNIVFVFTPELIEIKNISISRLFNGMNNIDMKLIQSYFPDSIDKLKKMRDLEEPDDEVTKIIIHDDVDKLQSIVSTGNNVINKGRIPSNIFDPFDNSISRSYLDFACECGSIKCFKYLLLNHADLDTYTFGFAIYGNNPEIIHSIEQKMEEKRGIYKNRSKSNTWDNMLSNPIYIAIQRNQYDTFDWLFDKKIASTFFKRDYLQNYADVALNNGNIHAFIRFIDNGLNLNVSTIRLRDWINNSASNGFYRQTKMLFSICNCENYIRNIGSNSRVPIKFGNLSIFKLFYPQKNPRYDYDTFLQYAIKNDHFSIVKYIVNELYEPKEDQSIQTLIQSSIESKSSQVFNFINEKFNLKEKIAQSDFTSTLNKACKSMNFDACKLIIDLVYEKNKKADFTSHFIDSAKIGFIEFCNYLNDKKVTIDLNKVVRNYQLLDKRISKIIFDLIEKTDNDEKEKFITLFFNESIKNGNKELTTLLSKYDPMINNQSLFYAVKNHDIDSVDFILKHKNDPFFINAVTKEGSVLNIAVMNNDITIVKRLLSIPGINASLPDKDNNTPLLISIKKLNYEITFLILDFYGDKIQAQISQLNQSIKIIMEEISQQNSTNFINVLKRIIKVKNIDLNFYQNKHTFLTKSCIYNNSEIVKILLESNQVDVNLYELNNFNTPLIISVINGNAIIAKQLIEYPKTNVNLANGELQTALTIASTKHQIEIIKLLIECERFDPIESNINYAFYYSNDEISKLLINIKGLNVNCSMYKQMSSTSAFETLLSYSINEKQIEKIKLIINHPSFDPQKSNAKEMVFNDFVISNDEIFDLLISKLSDNVNVLTSNGESLFVFASKKLNEKLMRKILNYPGFKPNENDFIIAYDLIKNKQTFSDLKNEMIKYDKSHNNYLSSTINSKINVSFGWAAKSSMDIFDTIEKNSQIDWINGLTPPNEFKEVSEIVSINNSLSIWSRIPKKPVIIVKPQEPKNSVWGVKPPQETHEQQNRTWGRNLGSGSNRGTWGKWGISRQDQEKKNVENQNQDQGQESISMNSPLYLITTNSESQKNQHSVHRPEKPKDASPRSKQRQTMTQPNNEQQKNSLSQTQKKVEQKVPINSNSNAKLNNSQPVSSSSKSHHPVSPPQKTATSNNNQARKPVNATSTSSKATSNSENNHQTKSSTPTKMNTSQPVSSANNSQTKPNSAVVRSTNGNQNGQVKVVHTQDKKTSTTPASSTANQNAALSSSQKIHVTKVGEETKSDLPPINKV